MHGQVHIQLFTGGRIRADSFPNPTLSLAICPAAREVHSQTGLKIGKAHALLKSALEKVQSVDGIEVVSFPTLTQQELEIVNFCATAIRTPYPIEEADLRDEFMRVLKELGCEESFTEDERLLIGKRLSKLVVRLASGTRINNADGSEAGYLQFLEAEGKIQVSALAHAANGKGLSASVYASTLTLADDFDSCSNYVPHLPLSEATVEITRDWLLTAHNS